MSTLTVVWVSFACSATTTTLPRFPAAVRVPKLPGVAVGPDQRDPRTPEEAMTDEPRDQRPEIRLSQLSHGAG